MLATPNGNILWTCDDAVIHQLFTLHPKVEQPIELVKFYDLWGPTISSVEGDQWKAHRKAVSAGLNSSMNNVVWEETRHQTEALAAHWVDTMNSKIPVIRRWTLSLALHVISSSFFNKRIEWADHESTATLEPGHKMTLDKALFTLLARLSTVFMTPKAILGKLPGTMFEEAHAGFTEVTKYFQELRAGALNNIGEIANKKHKSLLGKLMTPSPKFRRLISTSFRGNCGFSSRSRNYRQDASA